MWDKKFLIIYKNKYRSICSKFICNSLILFVSYRSYESLVVVVVVEADDDDDVDKFLLPDTPSTILSIPIIKRLTANKSINRNNPKKGSVMTRNDTTIDNIPTPIRKALDHFEVCLSKIPWTILATPKNARPTASKVTKNPIVNIGKAITTIANPIVNAPNIMLLILDDFVIFGNKPIDILSIPTTNNVSERRKIRSPNPNPGLDITAIEKAKAMIPTIICKILIPLEIFLSDEVIAANIQWISKHN